MLKSIGQFSKTACLRKIKNEIRLCLNVLYVFKVLIW